MCEFLSPGCACFSCFPGFFLVSNRGGRLRGLEGRLGVFERNLRAMKVVYWVNGSESSCASSSWLSERVLVPAHLGYLREFLCQLILVISERVLVPAHLGYLREFLCQLILVLWESSCASSSWLSERVLVPAHPGSLREFLCQLVLVIWEFLC